MFGYVLLNEKTLSEEEKKRFRAFYCGLCHTLKQDHGSLSRVILSYDMTFLTMLLSALYEPDEKCYDKKCVLHPLKKHSCVENDAMHYAADMNVLLAYHKCTDDVADEGSLRGRVGEKQLRNEAQAVEKKYPRQAKAVREALQELSKLEKEKTDDIDRVARLAGNMLGECYVWREDVFAPSLRGMGEALGRFIYLMDAYEDYDKDKRGGQFNPLCSMHDLPDYEQRMEDILTMEMAQCVKHFDFLPIEQDDKLLRNVLYSGVWGKYASLNQKRKDTTDHE